jgi:serine/threonine-protein kinase
VSTVADSPHPEFATLLAFRTGRLTGAARAAVSAHLSRCAACEASAVGSSADTPTTHDPSGPPEVHGPDVPEQLVGHARYRVLDRIGEGGMGVVYRAEHRVMGRVVALKVLNTGVSSNPLAVERFHREVRLASRLNHANIVTAFDADESGGLHFLVMEFVEGTSLDQLVRARGPLPIGSACECARQAALGLQHAHDKGMIHRDIKPHNLMLARTGQVKILDFGLARVAQTDGLDPTSVTAQALTQPHALVGTPDFLSPEQARSAVALDARSDFYSLGCTLYYLLTGQPPYGGVGAYAKMIAHVREPVPDATAARPEVPPELAAVLRKLMAKAPEDRHQRAADVAAALAPFAAPIPDALSGSVGPGAAGGAAAETLPSYASDRGLASLPLAAEYEPSDGNRPAVTPIHGDRQARPEPVERPRRSFTTAALIVLILGGVGLGAAASRWHRFGATPTTETEHVARQPGGGPHDSSAVAPQHDPGPVPAPKPKPPAEVPKPKPVEPPVPPPVPAGRKKKVLVLVPNDFASGELSHVTELLKQHGVGVSIIGPEKKPLDGYRHGGKSPIYVKTIEPELGAKDVTTALIDGADALILIPGNVGAFGLKGVAGSDYARIVRRMVQQKKVVGAIASGIVPLAAHGFLQHAEVSAYTAGNPTAITQLWVKKWSAGSKVVVDPPFVTAGEFASARALTEEVLRAIPEHHAK